MPTIGNTTFATGLRPFEVELENGEIRQVLAPSLDSAITGVFPSAVIRAQRGTDFDPADPPEVTALVPNTAQIGDPNFTLHVQGTGFREGDEILWNGNPEPTTFVSDTELTTEVNMATAEVAMPIPVAVLSFGVITSNALTFTLTPA